MLQYIHVSDLYAELSKLTSYIYYILIQLKENIIFAHLYVSIYNLVIFS